MIGASIAAARRISPRIFIFMTIFVDMLGYGIVIPLLPLYVERQASGGMVVGGLAALLNRLRPRFGEQWLALGGMALMAARMLLIALAPQAWMLFPIVGLLAVGSNLSIPCLTSLISAQVEPGRQGRLMGSLQVVINAALVGGPPIAGLAFDYLGASAPYALGASIALLALVAGRAAVGTHRAILPDG